MCGLLCVCYLVECGDFCVVVKISWVNDICGIVWFWLVCVVCVWCWLYCVSVVVILFVCVGDLYKWVVDWCWSGGNWVVFGVFGMMMWWECVCCYIVSVV